MAKHQHIQDVLIEGIRAGEYPPESRLPSERELAARFGVSYLTARHAVAQLVEANLVERRARSGTFVRPSSLERLASRTYYLLCTPDDHSQARAFLRLGARQIEAHGGRPRVIRVQDADDRDVLRAVRSGDPVLAMLGGFGRNSPLAAAMQAADGRGVLVTNRMDDIGIPSVVADDTQALRLAIAHLRERGHRRIALLCDDPSHPIARVQVAAWRAWCGATDSGLDDRLIAVRTPSYACLPTTAYDAVGDFLHSADRSHDVTAIVSLVDEMVAPTLAACRDSGRPVPEAVSIVSLGGDNAVFTFTHPAVTSVDVDIEAHVDQALAVAEAAVAGTLDPDDRLRLIEPRLIERQSVRTLTGDAESPVAHG